MAFITESFKTFRSTTHAASTKTPSKISPAGQDPESTDFSSQDATLLEVRDQILKEQAQRQGKTRSAKRSKRVPQRGVPTARNSLPMLGGHAHSSLARLTHSITLTWYGVTFVKRNSPISPRELQKFFDVTDRKAPAPGPEMAI